MLARARVLQVCGSVSVGSGSPSSSITLRVNRLCFSGDRLFGSLFDKISRIVSLSIMVSLTFPAVSSFQCDFGLSSHSFTSVGSWSWISS